MKKVFFTLCLLALALACGKDTLTVKGTIAEGETYPEDSLVYLMDGDDVLDSTTVTDGTFTLKAPANPEKLYRICAEPGSRSWNFGVIAEAGTVSVTLSANPMNSTIKDAPLNQRYTEFNQQVRDIYNEYRQKAAGLADDAEDEAEQLYEQTMGKIKDLSLDAIDKNADNYIAKAALQNIVYDLDLDELKEIVDKCKFIGNDESIQRIITCKEAALATAEGARFVDFAGKTPDGADVRLSDFVGQGRWVLADFWASWCGPCMGEIPNIKKTHETLSGDKFTVLGIAVWERNGDNTASAKKMEEKDMTWPQIFVGDDKTPTDSHGILGIPTMILFAPDGTIFKRGDELRGSKMMETIREIINQ